VHSLGPPRISGGRRLVREVGLALVAAGVVVLLFVVYELVGTNFSEEHSQAQLSRDFKAAVAGARPAERPSTAGVPGNKAQPGHNRPPAKKGAPRRAVRPGRKSLPRKKGPVGTTSPTATPRRHDGGKPKTVGALAVPLPVPPPGGALDHMVIPAIGVDRYVVEGVGEADLQMGPGHYPGTPLPGQAGNVGIAGHRTTFGAPFFRLNELVRGDYIYLTDTSGKTWVYSVVRQWVVAPSDVAVLDATRKPELTLTTCNPRFEATTRLIVRAALVEGLPRGTRLAGRLPVSAPRTATTRAPTTSRPTTPPPTTTVPTTPRPTTTVPATTVPATTSSTVASAPTTSGAHPGHPGTGGAGADSPTVGVGTGSVSLSGGGAGVWAAALGWGALALLVWVATRALAGRRARFAKAGVLVCGALVCLVPLWFAFAKVVDLLPANL
jgi:sortase A